MEATAARPSVMMDFVAHADGVILLVVALLVLGSVASWAIIIEKSVRLLRLRGTLRRIEALVPATVLPTGDAPALLTVMLGARDAELPEGQGLADYRARRGAAMRAAYLVELRRLEGGLPFLATLASTAPFIGLFGTVWGIMRSFSEIAASKDTSIAIVAPGIAEALFATAIGLGAAIPAVVAYNLCRATLARCGQRLAAVAQVLAKAPSRPAPERR